MFHGTKQVIHVIAQAANLHGDQFGSDVSAGHV